MIDPSHAFFKLSIFDLPQWAIQMNLFIQSPVYEVDRQS